MKGEPFFHGNVITRPFKIHFDQAFQLANNVSAISFALIEGNQCQSGSGLCSR